MKRLQLPDSAAGIRFVGVVPPAAGVLVAMELQHSRRKLAIVVAATRSEAEFLATDIRDALGSYCSAVQLLALPPLPDPESPETVHFHQQCDVLATLSGLHNRSPSGYTIIATTPAALCQPLPGPAELTAKSLHLKTGIQYSFEKLIQTLATTLDYDAEAVCEYPGQFAVRGGLIDVYPPNTTRPFRLDFFGDSIESIRAFDPATQITEETVDEVVLEPLSVNQPDSPPQSTFFDHLADGVSWIISEVATTVAQHHSVFSQPERIHHLPNQPNLRRWLEVDRKDDHWVFVDELEKPCDFLPNALPTIEVQSTTLEPILRPLTANFVGSHRATLENAQRKALLEELHAMTENGAEVMFATRSQQNVAQMEEFLSREWPVQSSPAIVSANLDSGFILRADGLPCWPEDRKKIIIRVTERELLGHSRQRMTGLPQRRLPNHSQVEQLLDFTDLVDGDYLVHLQSGICIYRGISKLKLDGTDEEVITLEFDDTVLLHIRLHDAHLLSRYVGFSKAAPKLGRLGTNQWERARSAAEKATLDYAAELLRIQAARNAQPGHAFVGDNPWQAEFEANFPFNETRDQATAIDVTKADMEMERPMDRLICGDVGFGKTEIALRAAAKACFGGNQVAVLVPTTVLAQQHFNTFKERFAPFPVVVEMLSRFRSPAEQKTIKSELKNGRIDIVIGTHSLLSRSIRFRDLGLLVVDEEHRFGVRHKEQIKSMRTSIDVLTMSATPIPRTLYLALMGARDLSVIETAPVDRHPIQTIVKPYSADLVQVAIRNELERGGQVFYLHNRIDTIASVAARLNDLIPTARIGIGHGQMEDGQLEGIMTDFVAGRYDILVCTTIIESGLDIPNVNTLIIEGADRFGLAQLYQIRGRVGRFNRQAYAYLLLHRHTHLLGQAHKRLAAIKQYNQLGAGFRIAMKDLELRGSGNILGAAQSGHIAAIGFDLYCQLLRQSIARLKGDTSAAAIRCTLRFDFIHLASIDSDDPAQANAPDAPASAAIPHDYVNEPRLQMDIYRRLSLANQLASIEAIEAEIRDRFGKLPRATARLLQMHRIRILAEHSAIQSIEVEGNRLKCRRARPVPSQFIMIGNRFPRLTRKTADTKLGEIFDFLKRRLTDR